MDIIQTLHSINRWIVVVLGIAAAIKFVVGWLRNHSYQGVDRGLMGGYTGLLDLQLLMGIILLVGLGLDTRFRLEHAITMILAIILAHLAIRWRRADDTVRFRNNSAVIIAGLLLIFAGVSVLPQGW